MVRFLRHPDAAPVNDEGKTRGDWMQAFAGIVMAIVSYLRD